MTQNDRFEKSASCPDNEILLAYQRDELNSSAADEVEHHLRGCEFCLLLLDLLAYHPREAAIPPDPPPLPESLLKKLRRLH